MERETGFEPATSNLGNYMSFENTTFGVNTIDSKPIENAEFQAGLEKTSQLEYKRSTSAVTHVFEPWLPVSLESAPKYFLRLEHNRTTATSQQWPFFVNLKWTKPGSEWSRYRINDSD